VETAERTFVDTDILIGVARKNLRAVQFWRRAEARSTMACSILSLLELFAGCRNLQEQRTTSKNLASVEIIHVESGDSRDALQWYQAFHLSQGIGIFDCLIAAAAARLGCAMYTLNAKHFRVVPGLQVKQPY
jgi:predicted nucleic acid-binding protein